VIGGAEAVIMVGGLAGALAAAQIRARVTVRQSILLLTVIGALAMLAAAAIMPSPSIAVPLAVPLVLSPATNAALFAIMLRGTPASMHGRATNSLMQVATALAALAPLAGGLVVENASAGWAMAMFGIALALVLPIALLLPSAPEGAAPN
jgi:predicted MFS family arabinose efflux permease